MQEAAWDETIIQGASADGWMEDHVPIDEVEGDPGSGAEASKTKLREDGRVQEALAASADYLAQALRALDTDKVYLGFSGRLSPIRVTPYPNPDPDNFGVVMPVQL